MDTIEVPEVPRTFDEIDWLRRFLGNPESLRNEATITSILRFSLMWNLFEKVIVGTDIRRRSFASRIQDKVENIRDYLDEDRFLKFYRYFVNRYVEDGSTNESFNTHLHFQHNDMKDLVKRVLLEGYGSGDDKNIPDMVTAILIIVYRFRNNLFHGQKNILTLDLQVPNFKEANEAIAVFLECVQISGTLVIPRD